MNQYRMPFYRDAVITKDGRAVPSDANGWLLPIDAAQEALLKESGAQMNMRSAVQFDGPVTMAGALVVAGTATFSGGITVFGQLNATSGNAVNLSPANATVYIQPTGSGSLSISPATTGSINNMSIGQSSPAVGKFSILQAIYLDSSGTPGNVTSSTPRGRAAFAAASASVVVTNSLVTAASTVQISVGGSDATLTTARVIPGAGAFTVTGNASATGVTPFDFMIIN